MDWRALLRRWLYDRVRTDWRTYPFSKRWVHRGLMMPSVGVEGPGRIVFAIDTSGSMRMETLAAAFGEVESLRRTFPCELDLVQCDAQIQEVRHFAAEDPAELPSDLAVNGRGGTDFRPVFEWLSRIEGPAPLIYFSDGFGTFPKDRPSVPVIWLLPRRSNVDGAAEFGQVVLID